MIKPDCYALKLGHCFVTMSIILIIVAILLFFCYFIALLYIIERDLAIDAVKVPKLEIVGEALILTFKIIDKSQMVV